MTPTLPFSAKIDIGNVKTLQIYGNRIRLNLTVCPRKDLIEFLEGRYRTPEAVASIYGTFVEKKIVRLEKKRNHFMLYRLMSEMFQLITLYTAIR